VPAAVLKVGVRALPQQRLHRFDSAGARGIVQEASAPEANVHRAVTLPEQQREGEGKGNGAVAR